LNDAMTNPGKGYLRVSVRAAREAFPIAGALVQVWNADREGDNTGLLYSMRTDEDGLTAPVELSAPAAAPSVPLPAAEARAAAGAAPDPGAAAA